MRRWLEQFLLITFVTLNTLSANAQKAEWIRNAEPSEDPYGETWARRVAVHPDGSVFVLGGYFGVNTVSGQPLNSPPNTLDDVFLAKYNAQGDLLWLKQPFQSTGFSSNRVLDLKVDAVGDLVFTGSFFSPSSILGSAMATGPLFIAKIDKEGNLIWINFQTTPGNVIEHDIGRRGNRIGFDANNNIYWLTDQIAQSGPSGALVVMKYTPAGVMLAAIPTVTPLVYERPLIQDFAVAADGNFIVSGNSSAPITIVGGPRLFDSANGQFFLARFTSSGDFVSVVYSNSGTNYITAHALDMDGNVYAALQSGGGTMHTPQGTTEMPAGNLLVKITTAGGLDWVNTILSNNGHDIMLANDGLLYVTGTSWGTTFRYQSYFRPIAGESGFVLKINQEGNFYGIYFGEPEDDPATPHPSNVQGLQSVVDVTGNIYTVGNFVDKQRWGCESTANRGFSFYLTKHAAATSPIDVIIGPSVICDGTEIELSTDLVSNGELYKWFTPGGPDPGAGTLLKNSITGTFQLADNTKPVIVSILDGCDEYFAEPFILPVLLPSAPVAPPVKDYCSASETHIVVEATGLSLTWYGNAELSEILSTNHDLVITPPVDGAIVYVTQTVSGCEGVPATITINDVRPEAPGVSAIVEYCVLRNTQIELTASGAGTLTWYDNANLSTVLATGSPAMVTPEDDKLFFVTQTVSACESPASEIVTKLIAGCITGVETDWAQSLSISPNPTNRNFKIRLDNHNKLTSINIVNSLGQPQLIIEDPRFTNNDLEISTHDWRPGVYIIWLKSKNETLTRKLMVN